MLSVGLVERRHFQLVYPAAGRLDLHFGADAQFQAARRSFAHRDLLRTAVGPPFTLRDLVSRRGSVGPAEFRILGEPSRVMLVLELRYRLAIQGYKPPGDARHQVEWLRNTRLALKKRLDSSGFVGGDVDQEHVGEFRRGRLADFSQDG